MGGFYVRRNGPSSGAYHPESLVARCATITRQLGKHQDIKKATSRLHGKEKEDKKETDKGSKPCDVLTTHGVLFFARYLDWLENCPRAAGDSNLYLSSPCSFGAEIGVKCKCSLHAKRLRKEFNDMPKEVIADLSKIDWVGRVIFMFQGSWMIIQTIGRKAAGLPISLLELHAALHAGIAVLQYTIWWFKPVDMVVMTPLTWPEENFKTWETEEVTNHHRLERETDQLLHRVDPIRPHSSGDVSSARSLITHHSSSSQSHFQSDRGQASIADPESSHPGEVQNYPPGVSRLDTRYSARIHRWWSGLLVGADAAVFSDHYFTSRATLGKEGYKQVTGYVSVVHNPVKGITLAIVMLTLTWHRWPYKALLWFGSCLTYSAMHLGAWHWHFPTHTEKILWHWCTSLTTGSLGTLSLLAFLATLYRTIRLLGVKHEWGIFSQVARSDGFLFLYRNGVRMVGVSIAVGAIPWLLARLYIFVEAVISVRSLPKGTYATLDWSGFIPHI